MVGYFERRTTLKWRFLVVFRFLAMLEPVPLNQASKEIISGLRISQRYRYYELRAIRNDFIRQMF